MALVLWFCIAWHPTYYIFFIKVGHFAIYHLLCATQFGMATHNTTTTTSNNTQKMQLGTENKLQTLNVLCFLSIDSQTLNCLEFNIIIEK